MILQSYTLLSSTFQNEAKEHFLFRKTTFPSTNISLSSEKKFSKHIFSSIIISNLSNE